MCAIFYLTYRQGRRMKGETYYEKDRRESDELPQLCLLSARVFFLYVLRVRILNRPKTAFLGDAH